MLLPQAVQDVAVHLARLPGLGRKSALRIAMCLLEWPEDVAKKLGKDIIALREELGQCPVCGTVWTKGEICDLCRDPARDKNILCVVSEWDALLAMEHGGFYHGQYLVLGSLARAGTREAIEAQELLLKRLARDNFEEVIFALGSTLEADNAATYLRERVQEHYPGVVTSRLAQGMPLGAEVKHMDQETLRQSMRHRQKL